MNIFVLDVYVQVVNILQQEHHIHHRAISQWGTAQSNKAQMRMMDQIPIPKEFVGGSYLKLISGFPVSP
jgi:hypothetical protein